MTRTMQAQLTKNNNVACVLVGNGSSRPSHRGPFFDSTKNIDENQIGSGVMYAGAKNAGYG